MTYHVFFESLDAWVAASGPSIVYAMPMQLTRPAEHGMAWKESKILLSQLQSADGVVHHCLFLIGRWLAPVEQDKAQKHAERLEQRWQQLKTWLDRGRYPVLEGMLSFPKELTTIDTYLPQYVTEAQDAPDAAANPA